MGILTNAEAKAIMRRVVGTDFPDSDPSGAKAKNLLEKIVALPRCSCGTPLDGGARFCMFCGTADPSFTIEAMKRELGYQSIEESMVECGPPHRPPEGPDEKFCFNCGRKY